MLYSHYYKVPCGDSFSVFYSTYSIRFYGHSNTQLGAIAAILFLGETPNGFLANTGPYVFFSSSSFLQSLHEGSSNRWDHLRKWKLTCTDRCLSLSLSFFLLPSTLFIFFLSFFPRWVAPTQRAPKLHWSLFLKSKSNHFNANFSYI